MPPFPSDHRDRPLEPALPSSLTRFLSNPSAAIVEPSRAERARPRPSVPTSPNIALRLAIGWAVFYNIAGGAILWWLWSTMG